MEVELQTPIKAHNETLTKLTLREATGADLFKAGSPYKVELGKDGGLRTVYDMGAVRVLISELASIPTSSVDAMSWPDIMKLAGMLVNFTGGSRNKSSTESSS